MEIYPFERGSTRPVSVIEYARTSSRGYAAAGERDLEGYSGVVETECEAIETVTIDQADIR